MAHAGIRSKFELENASGTVIDISSYLTDVGGSGSTDFLDGTTFQPNATNPIKNEIPSFASFTKSLSGMWTEEAEAFFTGINGRQNLTYREWPAFGDGVDAYITGECSCGSYSGPIYSVGGLVTFTAELRIQTRSLAGSPA
jgi:hypothetical protein